MRATLTTSEGSSDTKPIRRPEIAAPAASSPAVRTVMRANRGRDTRPESDLRAELHRRGLRFRKHARPLAAFRCQADVLFRSARVAVFVDGCFWHGCPQHGRQPSTNTAYWALKLQRNRERDRRNDDMLTAAGWVVIRVWEHEEMDAVATAVAQLVRERRGVNGLR